MNRQSLKSKPSDSSQPKTSKTSPTSVMFHSIKPQSKMGDQAKEYHRYGEGQRTIHLSITESQSVFGVAECIDAHEHALLCVVAGIENRDLLFANETLVQGSAILVRSEGTRGVRELFGVR